MARGPRVRERLRLGTALNELGAVVDELAQPFEAALGVLAARDAQHQQSFDEAAEAALADLAASTEAAEQVPAEVADLLAAHTERLTREADVRLARLWEDLRDEYRSDAKLCDDPQQLMDLLASWLALLSTDLGTAADKAVAGVRDEIVERFGHRVRARLQALLPAAPMPEPFVPGAGAHSRPSPVEMLVRAAEAAAQGAQQGLMPPTG
ncbi:hypothetical protein ACFQ9X_28925 [Catenulispora yoronensis]